MFPLFTPSRLLAVGLLVTAAGSVAAQGPVILWTNPRANALTAFRTTGPYINFNQALLPGVTDGLQVFSQQHGGRRTHRTPAVQGGHSLRFTPADRPYLPGETLQYSLTTAVANATGPLPAGRIGQFTTAVGGTGRGTAWAASELAAGFAPRSLTVGDVDGDGDLDLLTTTGVVNVSLNGGDNSGSNTARFSNGQTVVVGSSPSAVLLADIDNDGDLDLLTANATTNGTVSVRLNGGNASGSGTGIFSGTQEVLVGAMPSDLAVGDVDGDGDLDLVTPHYVSNTVSVRLNGAPNLPNTVGSFGGGRQVAVDAGPERVALADVDSDGDLDLLTSNTVSNTLSVRLNGGDASGSNDAQFTNGYDLPLTGQVTGFTVGDVNADSHLDLVVLNAARDASTATVYLNAGALASPTAHFARGQVLPLANGPSAVQLGDLDADGDLDLVTTHGDGPSGSVAVHLNGGNPTGSSPYTFVNGPTLATGSGPYDLALADMDGDDDLDLLTANYAGTTASLRLNGGTVLATTPRQLPDFALAPNPSSGATPVRTTGLAGAAPVTVLDALGRPVLHTTADAAGTATLRLPAGLAPGLYLVRSGGRSQRLLVE
ncbi:T9SS type A sorting domain-containing protein [Hymenobacter sp. ASUV-10]|uniref:T9SS type A sorting domain-containing protein n=1 Tax=Hymenobacter aranciens TaxID=3063996 RepID=A0ABT9BAL9_9BACT|nr:T9SS type A sorting domain-containing protein [Hymenobacter sp. ASUV-10]MDO7875283.1 T9SS type A sorting domain-containing protein [Hymenobacter sp. ASUV-10]